MFFFVKRQCQLQLMNTLARVVCKRNAEDNEGRRANKHVRVYSGLTTTSGRHQHLGRLSDSQSLQSIVRRLRFVRGRRA